MSDLTVAVSEATFRRLFEKLRDGLARSTSGARDLGPFSVAWNIGFRLKGGSIDLQADGSVRVSELDIVYDPLDLTLGVDLPEICVGGFCIIPIPFDGCALRAPKICVFSAPPAYSSLRHRLAVEGREEVQDGRGCRGGRGPGGARLTRWRRRGHPHAPAADVGGAQAGGRAAAAAGRGPGVGLARSRGNSPRAERLAGSLPGRRRGVAAEPAGGRPGRRDRPPEGEGGRADDGQRAARGQDRAAGDRPPFGPTEVEAMSRQVSPSTNRPYGL